MIYSKRKKQSTRVSEKAMKYYKVFVSASGFRMKVEGESHNYSFCRTVFVKAEKEDQAYVIAKNIVVTDQELANLNERAIRPLLHTDDIAEVSQEEYIESFGYKIWREREEII